ncbi:MAG: 50S ribosomal protein L19 [Candidatus Dojkabacteria bacterium]|jgi:large subunit ribosomal protein L19
MDTNIKKKIEGDSYKKRPDVKVGDHVKLYMRIIEGKKERVQQFKGVVIAIKGTGLNKNLVVRKISYGIGVERIVPLHSPMLDKIEIVKRGSVRKSKLFYLRKRVGRKALKIDNVKDVYMTDEVEVPEEGEPEVQEEVVEEVVEEESKEEEVKKEE